MVLLPLLAMGRSGSARAAGSVVWKGCGDGFDCATLQVPLDYNDTTKGTIGLALIRQPAADQGKRIGSLLTNPGGPGGSGVDFVREWAPSLDSSITARFDIVGFDPRGVGASAPIDCHANLQAYIAADPTPDTPQEFTQLQQASRAFDDACASKYGDVLPYLGTKNVARDLDRLREALGDDKLTYLGFSYGTEIGQVYAGMFPQKVRAMVLDGAVDLSLDPEQGALTQAQGFERALQNYIADCVAKKCALQQRGGAEAAIDQVMAKAEAAPIPSKSADRPAGPGETLLGIIAPLYAPNGGPALTLAITRALDGDGSMLVTLADTYLERKPDGTYPNITETNLAVNCLDSARPPAPADFAAYQVLAARYAQASPHFGASLAADFSCEYWAAKPDPIGPADAAGAPPIVVVSTTGDPATPYEWGQAVAKQLKSGVLITNNGEGHTAYGQNSCVDGAVNAYLLALKAPTNGATCGESVAASAPGKPGAPAQTNQRAPSEPDATTEVRRSAAVLAAIALAIGALVAWLRWGRNH